MSCKDYQKAYEHMTTEEKNIMYDLFMKGINHDGHSWVTYGDVEKAVGQIILGRVKHELD